MSEKHTHQWEPKQGAKHWKKVCVAVIGRTQEGQPIRCGKTGRTGRPMVMEGKR